MDDGWQRAGGFGDRIRWARRQAGFTLAKDAAEALSIKASTYRSYERGEENDPRTPPLMEIIRIAKRFKINWIWLATGDGTPHDKPKPFGDLPEQISARLEHVPEEQRESVIGAIWGVIEAFEKRA